MFITGQTTNRKFQEEIKELIKDKKLEVTDLDSTVKTRNFTVTYDRYGNLVNTYENEGKEGFDPANPGALIEYPNMCTDKTMDPSDEDFVQYDYYRFTKTVPYQASPEYLRDALRGLKGPTLDLGEEQHIVAYNNEYLTNPLDESDEIIKADKYKDTDSAQLNSDFSQINLAVLAKLNSAGDVETGSDLIEKINVQVVLTKEGSPIEVVSATAAQVPDGLSVDGKVYEEYVEFKDLINSDYELSVEYDEGTYSTTIKVEQDQTFILELETMDFVKA